MKSDIVGISKMSIYARVAFCVSIRYFPRMTLGTYLRFMRSACIMLWAFRHNKVMKICTGDGGCGYKLHLYFPAYPTKAFFYAIENKFLRDDPAPVSVVFSMTKACDYKCPHCYQRMDGGRDLEEWKLTDTLLSMHKSGISMFLIEGGEPFLKYDRLLSLVRLLDESAEVWVNTAGDRVTEDRLRELRLFGLAGIMVSIHSPNPTKHDKFTGVKGSFLQACKVIKLAKSLGVMVTINSVLSEEEIRVGGIDELMLLAKSIESDFVQLIHPKPAGKWLNKQDGMQKERGLLSMAEDAHVMYNSRRKIGYPSLSAQVFEERKKGMGCTAGGIDRFYINAYGEVQPCEFLNISFGNVNQESYGEIFARMRSYFSEPCENWLCCTQAGAIQETMEKHALTKTPIPWEFTKELVDNWDRGKPTSLYKSLKIYR